MRQALHAPTEQQRDEEGDPRTLVAAEAGQLKGEIFVEPSAHPSSDASDIASTWARDGAAANAGEDIDEGSGVSRADSGFHSSFSTENLPEPCADASFPTPDGEPPGPPTENLLLGHVQAHFSFAESDILQRLSNCVENTQWLPYSDSAGICVSNCPTECKTPGRERLLLMWQVRAVLKNCTQKDAFAIILDTASQASWNRYVSKVVDHGRDHGAQLLQTCFKGVFPIAAREALEFRSASADESAETLWIGFSSLGTEGLDVPVTPKHERTYTTMSGYRFAKGPEPNTVAFTFISHVDAGGSVPDWLIMKAGAKGPIDLCKDLQAFIDKTRR